MKYRIRSKDSTGATSIAANCATLIDTTAPSTPSSIVVSDETDTTAVVSWAASTDNVAVTEYAVFEDDDQTGPIDDPEVVLATTSGTSATITGDGPPWISRSRAMVVTVRMMRFDA